MSVRDEFLTNNIVHLEGAIPRDFCDNWVQEYFDRTGVDESDPGTFPDDPLPFSSKSGTAVQYPWFNGERLSSSTSSVG